MFGKFILLILVIGSLVLSIMNYMTNTTKMNTLKLYSFVENDNGYLYLKNNSNEGTETNDRGINFYIPGPDDTKSTFTNINLHGYDSNGEQTGKWLCNGWDNGCPKN